MTATLLILTGLVGCKDPESFPSAGEFLSASDPVEVRLGQGVGVGEVDVPFRVVNRLGAAVAGPAVTLEAEGIELSQVEATVEPDALGVGRLTLSSETAQQLEVRITSTDGTPSIDGTPQPSWILAEAPHPTPMLPARSLEYEPVALAPADRGVILASGDRIDWLPADPGALSTSILDLELPGGLRAGIIDGDGALDVATWKGDEVYLLRGRGGSGSAWGAGYWIDGSEIVDVGLGDLDGDRITDVAILFSEGDRFGVQVLLGDGIWGFTETLPVDLDQEASSVAMGDFTGDGLGELAILVDGEIARLRYNPDAESAQAWQSSGSTLPLELDPGGRLLEPSDITGDGVQDLVVLAPQGDTRKILLYRATGTPTRFTIEYPAIEAALGDVTGDGLDDMVLATEQSDGQLVIRAVSMQRGTETLLDDGLAPLRELGPVAVGDFDLDGIADVAVAGEQLTVHRGRYGDSGDWESADGDWVTYAFQAVGPMRVLDVDDDGWADVLAVRSTNDEVGLQSYRFGVNDKSGGLIVEARDNGGVGLDDFDPKAAGSVLDMAICDDEIYLLGDDGGGVLHRVDNRASDGRLQLVGSVAVAGDYVACGDFDGGRRVAVAARNGTLTWFTASLVADGSGDLGTNLGDLAAGDVDGAGVGVVSCSGDCSVVVADLDGDGLDDIVQGGEAPAVFIGGEWTDLALEGEASVLHIDGDGRLDAGFSEAGSGRVAVHRSVLGAVAPPLGWVTGRDIVGPAMSGDVDGDGIPELLFEVAGGSLMHAQASSGATP